MPSLLVPREPDAKTHAENAIRMEWITEAVKVEGGSRREAISVDAPTFGHEADAMIGGDLLWTSTLVGVDGRGGGDLGVDEQLDRIFEQRCYASKAEPPLTRRSGCAPSSCRPRWRRTSMRPSSEQSPRTHHASWWPRCLDRSTFPAPLSSWTLWSTPQIPLEDFVYPLRSAMVN